VPSLSNVAMRCGTGTKPAAPGAVTWATKSVMLFFVAPLFQEGRGSFCADDAAVRPQMAMRITAAATNHLRTAILLQISGCAVRSAA
jgi:hypothetical protein